MYVCVWEKLEYEYIYYKQEGIFEDAVECIIIQENDMDSSDSSYESVTCQKTKIFQKWRNC
jgi:hypothetical protein